MELRNVGGVCELRKTVIGKKSMHLRAEPMTISTKLKIFNWTNQGE